MLKELKKQSIARGMSLVFSFLFMSIVLFALGFKDLQQIRTGPVPFAELAPKDLSKNVCVELSLTENFGSYMEEYEQKIGSTEKKTTKVCYLIGMEDTSTGEYQLLSLVVPAEYEDELEQMADNTFDGIASKAVQFTCSVADMGSEERAFAEFYLKQMGFQESEMDEILLPYHLAYCDWEAKTMLVYILCGGGALLAVITVLLLIYTLGGFRLRKMEKDIEKSGYSLDFAEADYMNAKILMDKPIFRLGRVFTFCSDGATPHIILNRDIVWGFHNVVVQRGRSRLIKKTTHYVVLKTKNKKTYVADVPNEAKANLILNLMNNALPWMVIGDSNALHKMYSKDLQGFLNLQYNKFDDKSTNIQI